MKRKALCAYTGLLLITTITYIFRVRFLDVLPVFYCFLIPFFLRRELNLYFSVRDIGLGLLVSAAVLVPLLWLQPRMFSIRSLSFPVLMIQFFGVARPEEVFFRGFLQDVFGSDLKSVIVVSGMFSAAHLPALLIQGDLTAPLTFFPSIIMGLLYLKTSNALTPAIFHVLSNVTFSGFMI